MAGTPIAAHLGDEAADAIYGKDARSIMSGTVFPPGRAVPLRGGYQVSGRWIYASGCWHAAYMAFCNIYDLGAPSPRLSPSGAPEMMVAHVPRAGDEDPRHLGWKTRGDLVLGHDVMIEDAFVLDPFVWKFVPNAPRGLRSLFYLNRFPFAGFFSWPMAAVALGIAQAAIDEITETSRRKTPRLSTGTLRDKPLFQAQLAQPSRWRVQPILAPRGRGDDLAENRSGNPRVIRRAGRVQSRGGQCNTQRGGRCRARLHRRRRQRQLPAESSAATSARYPWRDTTHRHRACQFETSGRMLLGLQPDSPLVLF